MVLPWTLPTAPVAPYPKVCMVLEENQEELLLQLSDLQAQLKRSKEDAEVPGKDTVTPSAQPVGGADDIYTDCSVRMWFLNSLGRGSSCRGLAACLTCIPRALLQVIMQTQKLKEELAAMTAEKQKLEENIELFRQEMHDKQADEAKAAEQRMHNLEKSHMSAAEALENMYVPTFAGMPRGLVAHGEACKQNQGMGCSCITGWNGLPLRNH